jgi:hypothetical protein
MVFMNPADYTSVLQSQVKSSGALFIELNKFIVKVGKASQITQGQIGLSKFQRDAMMIAKNDELRFILPKIIPNPLSQIELSIDIVYQDDEYPVDQKGAAIIKEKDIQQAFVGLF